MRQALSGAGFDEAVTVSLVEDRLAVAVTCLDAQSPRCGSITPSRKQESAASDRSLIPSLLAARLHNETHGQGDADLFEIANVYLARPGQAPRCRWRPTHPGSSFPAAEFREMKGVIESLLRAVLHVKGSLSKFAR